MGGIWRLNCGGKTTQPNTGGVIEVDKPHLRQRGGAHKRAIAVIPAGPVVTRILRHVGLPAEPEDFTEIRGPPEDLWPPGATCTSHDLDADFDMTVVDDNGPTTVATSMTWDSNDELVEFLPQAGHTYTVRINSYEWKANATFYGIAWKAAPYTSK